MHPLLGWALRQACTRAWTPPGAWDAAPVGGEPPVSAATPAPPLHPRRSNSAFRTFFNGRGITEQEFLESQNLVALLLLHMAPGGSVMAQRCIRKPGRGRSLRGQGAGSQSQAAKVWVGRKRVFGVKGSVPIACIIHRVPSCPAFRRLQHDRSGRGRSRHRHPEPVALCAGHTLSHGPGFGRAWPGAERAVLGAWAARGPATNSAEGWD